MTEKIKLFVQKVDAVFKRYATFFKWLCFFIGVCLAILDLFMFLICQSLIVVLASYTGFSDKEGLASLAVMGMVFSFMFVAVFVFIVSVLLKMIIKKEGRNSVELD